MNIGKEIRFLIIFIFLFCCSNFYFVLGVQIDDCISVEESNVDYFLTKDIGSSQVSCVKILNVNDVTIDCGGHKIFSDAYSLNSVFIENSYNIILKNCVLRSQRDAIYSVNSNKLFFNNLRFLENSQMILKNSKNSKFVSLQSSNIFLDNSGFNNFSDSNFVQVNFVNSDNNLFKENLFSDIKFDSFSNKNIFFLNNFSLDFSLVQNVANDNYFNYSYSNYNYGNFWSNLNCFFSEDLVQEKFLCKGPDKVRIGNAYDYRPLVSSKIEAGDYRVHLDFDIESSFKDNQGCLVIPDDKDDKKIEFKFGDFQSSLEADFFFDKSFEIECDEEIEDGEYEIFEGDDSIGKIDFEQKDDIDFDFKGYYRVELDFDFDDIDDDFDCNVEVDGDDRDDFEFDEDSKGNDFDKVLLFKEDFKIDCDEDFESLDYEILDYKDNEFDDGSVDDDSKLDYDLPDRNRVFFEFDDFRDDVECDLEVDGDDYDSYDFDEDCDDDDLEFDVLFEETFELDCDDDFDELVVRVEDEDEDEIFEKKYKKKDKVSFDIDDYKDSDDENENSNFEDEQGYFDDREGSEEDYSDLSYFDDLDESLGEEEENAVENSGQVENSFFKDEYNLEFNRKEKISFKSGKSIDFFLKDSNVLKFFVKTNQDKVCEFKVDNSYVFQGGVLSLKSRDYKLSGLSDLVYDVLNVEMINLDDSQIDEIGIEFRVAKSWIQSNGVEKIVVYRFSHSDKREIEPFFLREDRDYSYYKILAGGFSSYAIVGEVESLNVDLPDESLGLGFQEDSKNNFWKSFLKYFFVILAIFILVWILY